MLKFDNHDSSEKLWREKELWSIIYPEFVSKVRVEQWSGSSALMMPCFASIHKSERAKLRNRVHGLLMLIEKKGFWHQDVRWRNMHGLL